MAKKIDIAGQLNSAAADNKLADASQIYDSKKGKFQEKFNEDIENKVESYKQELELDVNNAVANLIGGASETFDTLKEFEDWVNNDKSGAAAIAKQTNDNKTAISDLQANTGISEYPTFDPAVDYTVGDVVKYEGSLYRFTAEHAAGEWIGTDVEKWSERKEIEGKVTELGSEVVKLYYGEIPVSFLSFLYNRTLVSGMIVDGNNRATVPQFMQCNGSININLKEGFVFSIHYYSLAKEDSFISSVSYQHGGVVSVPTNASYFRLVIKNESEESIEDDVSEVLLSIRTESPIDVLKEQLHDTDVSSKFLVGDSDVIISTINKGNKYYQVDLDEGHTYTVFNLSKDVYLSVVGFASDKTTETISVVKPDILNPSEFIGTSNTSFLRLYTDNPNGVKCVIAKGSIKDFESKSYLLSKINKVNDERELTDGDFFNDLYIDTEYSILDAISDLSITSSRIIATILTNRLFANISLNSTYRVAIVTYKDEIKVSDTGWKQSINGIIHGDYDKIQIKFYDSSNDIIEYDSLIKNLNQFSLKVASIDVVQKVQELLPICIESKKITFDDFNPKTVNGSTRVSAKYNISNLDSISVNMSINGNYYCAVRIFDKLGVMVSNTGWLKTVNIEYSRDDGYELELYFYDITGNNLSVEDVKENLLIFKSETRIELHNRVSAIESEINDGQNKGILYKGDRISLSLFEKYTCDETAYIEDLYPNDHRSGTNNNQSIAIFGDYIFAPNNGATMNVYKFSTKEFLKQVNLPELSHNNNLTFLNSHIEGDTFPLALLSKGDYNTDDSGYNVNEEYQEAYILRIDDSFNLIKVKTIIFKVKGSNCNMSCFVDNVRNKLYAYCLVIGDWRVKQDNYSYLYEFDLPDITNTETIILDESDVRRRFTFDYMIWQGAICHNGYMYAPIQRPYKLNGIEYNYSGNYMLRINLNSGFVENIVPIKSGYEPEGISVYNDKVYISFVTNSSVIEEGDVIFFINEYSF